MSAPEHSPDPAPIPPATKPGQLDETAEILEPASPTCYLGEFENLLKPPPAVRIKSVHEAPAASDGTRILVERPGAAANHSCNSALADWRPEAAPSAELQEWFAAAPAVRWAEFRERYWHELNGRPEALRPFYAALQKAGLTLVHDNQDANHNPASVLREYLLAHLP